MLLKGRRGLADWRVSPFQFVASVAILVVVSFIAFTRTGTGSQEQTEQSILTEVVNLLEQPGSSEKTDGIARAASSVADGEVLVLFTDGAVKNTAELKGFLQKIGSTVSKQYISGPYVAVLQGGNLLGEWYEAGAKSLKVKIHKHDNAFGQMLLANKMKLRAISCFTSQSCTSRVYVNKVGFDARGRGWNGVVLSDTWKPVRTLYLDSIKSDAIASKSITTEDRTLASYNWIVPTDRASDIAQLSLRISEKNFQKIEEKRNKAVERGILFTSSEDYVSGVLSIGGQDVPVNVRLKGDWTDHLRGDRWSFRIKTKGERTVLGMKVFSLQSPQTRGFLHEWLFHKAWEKLDGIALRYFFVNLELNGEDLGTYAFEEHFEKRLLENRNRREGPILKFDETAVWQQYDALQSASGALSQTSPVTAFKLDRTLESSVLRKNFLHGAELLDQFRRGALPAGQVFDLKKMAAYVALVDLFGSYHGVHWHNLRFYFNPVTLRMEPISFDTLGTPVGKRIAYRATGKDFLALLFQDQEFSTCYFEALTRVLAPEFLDSLLEEHADEIAKNLSAIRKNDREYSPAFERYKERRKEIQKILDLEPLIVPFLNTADRIVRAVPIRYSIIHPLPVRVTAVRLDDKTLPVLNPTTLLPLTGLNGFSETSLALSEELHIDRPEALKLVYTIPGTLVEKEVSLYPYRSPQTELRGFDRLVATKGWQDKNFLVVDEENKTILFKPGVWAIHERLVLPAGYQVRATQGVTLDLVNQSALVSYSPVEFDGSEEEPVRIHSSDGSGQGLFVLNARGSDLASSRSILRNVVFESLRNLSLPGSELTGAVTFYESPVSIERVLFSKNQSEDSLNIVRSNFSIADSVIEDTSGDAFDGDFCTGTVSRTRFLRIGNDALDFSGSSVRLTDITVEQCGDKGVSIGERSSLTATGLNVSRCQIGVASKDLSKGSLSSVQLTDVGILLAAYQKKPEFGPPELSASGLQHHGSVSLPYLIEKNARVEVNGEAILPGKKKQERLLLQRLRDGKPVV